MYIVLMFLKSFWEHMTDLWAQNGKPNKKQRCELPPLKLTVCYSKPWDPVVMTTQTTVSRSAFSIVGCLKILIQFNTVSKYKTYLCEFILFTN